MSVNPIGAVAQAAQQIARPRAQAPAPDVTPFSQQVDAHAAGGAHGHHQHHGSAQSVTSSVAGAASAAGRAPASAIASSLLNLLS